MGWLSWLFPSPQDRLERARAALARGAWVDARHEALALDLPEAAEVVEAADRALAQQNLDAAISWANAGDEARIASHLELAESFRRPGQDEAFREARREIREILAARAEAERRARDEREARLNSADPFGLFGGNTLLKPGAAPDLDPDAEEKAARVALIVEGYDKSLRDGAVALGGGFARALLDLEEGRADLALQALFALPDEAPVVAWERARCAHALGDAAAAAREVTRFADLAGGHHEMGRHHSGVFLAQLLAETGRHGEALRVLRDVRAREPEAGTALFAQLLEIEGQLPEAEQVLVGAIRKHGKALPLYGLLARVRVASGRRVDAMATLERAMDQCACGTGQCGKVAPDLGIVRTLATLYLEDGVEVPRGLELAEQAAGMTREPRWEDAYLAALAGRRRGDAAAESIVGQLWRATPAGDPRAEALARHLPQPA